MVLADEAKHALIDRMCYLLKERNAVALLSETYNAYLTLSKRAAAPGMWPPTTERGRTHSRVLVFTNRQRCWPAIAGCIERCLSGSREAPGSKTLLSNEVPISRFDPIRDA